MRALAAFLLLSLLAAFHAPLVAASETGMDCCAGGMSGMCCPLSGSCSMRSCRADEHEALLSAMGVFLLPAPAASMRPAASSFDPAPEAFSPIREAFPVLDPPPRG